MAEYCYTAVCGHGETMPESQARDTTWVCKILRQTIAEAGGGGFLEESPCPYVVIDTLKVSEIDSTDRAIKKLELCQKIGLIGFTSVEGLD